MPEPAFRLPAVPLIVHDPYFSIWSPCDRLTDGPTRHWTGAPHPLCGLIRIDGAAYRWMGDAPAGVPAMEQTSVRVLPTRTIYAFQQAGVRLAVTFLTPAILDPLDMELPNRPLSYIVCEAVSVDGGEHAVQVYLDASAVLCVDTPDEQVTYGRYRFPSLQVLRAGSRDQRILGRFGDNVRINWGYLYFAVPDGPETDSACVPDREARSSFLRDGSLPERDDLATPRPACERSPALCVALDFGPVGDAPASRYAMLAYDDVYSLEYFHQKVAPYWRRGVGAVADMLEAAHRDFHGISEMSARWDEQVMAELRSAGGEQYALLCALSYRQCLGAHKLAVDSEDSLVYLSKENFSNGCIGTVDVAYPSSPFFLCYAPELLKAQLRPILDYAASPRWPFPFAPHDLGTYPLANGQVYGGGEESERDQMPVEECGNMLLMVAALACVEGSADFAEAHWPVLHQWAAYLADRGFDPENQLCTDDFAGHLAHNANLSIKAILALAGFARLCEMTGRADEAARYRGLVEAMAASWREKAEDGDHYRLAFDVPGSWSQKYNLVWDSVLDLGVFPEEVAATESAFYGGQLQRYGLPLDNRAAYTKLDWEVWTATLAGTHEAFDAIMSRLYAFAHETPDRVPLSDWYDADTGRHVGFVARSVVGGMFLPVLKARLRKALGGR